MKKHRLDLIEDSLDLLGQVRAGLADDSTHSLVISKLDEAIRGLELLLVKEGMDG